MRKIKHLKVTKRIVALTMMTALMFSNAVFFVSADETADTNVSQSQSGDTTQASSDNQSGDSTNGGGSTTTDNNVAGDNTGGAQNANGDSTGAGSQNANGDSAGADGQINMTYPVMTMDPDMFGTTADYVLNGGNYVPMGADPADPTNPVDPTDPTDPTNPADPTDPTAPTDPEEIHYTDSEGNEIDPSDIFSEDADGHKVLNLNILFQTDEDGNLIKDEEGNYVADPKAIYSVDSDGYLLDKNGERILDENGDPIIVSDPTNTTIGSHVHTFGDYHYAGKNADGVDYHERNCTFSGCDAKETEDCDKEVVREGDFEVTRCKVCGQEFNRVYAKPVINSVEFSTTPEKDEDNIDLFKSDVTVTVNARCEAEHGATFKLEGVDQNSDAYVTFELTQEGDPDENGNANYTYTFSGNELFYSIEKVTGYANNYETDLYVERECKFTVNNTSMKVNGVAYITNSTDYADRVWIYDDDRYYSDNWYSSSIDGYPDTLFLVYRGSSNNACGYFTVYDNGEEISEEAITNKSVSHSGKNSRVETSWNGIDYNYTYIPSSKIFSRGRTFYELNYECKIPVSVEGEHTYLIKYGENSCNVETSEITINIDNTVPVIDSISYNGNSTPAGTSGADAGYYNEDVEVEVVVTEENLVNTEKLDDLKLVEEGGSSRPLTFKEKRGDKYVFSATASSEGKYHVEGFVQDKAKNRKNLAEQSAFIIDKTNPEITLDFDNTEAKNGKYYNAARIATVTIKDANFDPDDKYITLNISEKDGKAASGGWEKSSEGSYTKKINFDADGVYSFTVSCKDKAANASTSVSADEFVIDTSVPTIDVNFDNNTASNEYYYKDARQATIVVEDANFDSKLVVIEKTGEDGANALPSVGGFSDSDKKHSASMNFDKDGKYAFRVTCQDLAGNVAETYTSSVFVIDTVVPEVEITGVADMSANNGAVNPVITSTDENLNVEGVVVNLKGANNGTISSVGKATAVNGGFSVEIPDLPHTKENDDLYILTATITDLAGNVTEKEIKYSINRFGSVYVLGDGTLSMIDNYYVVKPQDVVVTEINVDELTYKEVSITYDGSVKELSSGRDYSTSETLNEHSWHSISYKVNSSNFRNDGLYSVSIYSEDKATNTQSNKAKGADIDFLVDSTAPSIVVAGVESDGVYQEAEHDFSVNATDTIGIAGLTVYLDDVVLAEFTAEELNENGGTEILTIPGKDDYQQLEIVCSDVAGNEANLSCNNILVSVQAQKLVDEDIIQKTAVDDDIIPTVGFLKKPITWIVIILITVLLITTGVITYKKKAK
ncbi:Ig-like domain (group 3) [Pseudobutyrivibrio sp. AR14]|uniref:Ig-like domain-containing protein n=1 Tax=Pseudobutyrivibrio sp. AR14 TaxID=1520804 RepID=UPI0008910C50|nr:Ig-like domain-containing protein [Pseudobutyrivibrio sp. AR14]SCX93979.1 Ig-like domain (group 3) [Pseudobutyrivibrio sp. AR14]